MRKRTEGGAQGARPGWGQAMGADGLSVQLGTRAFTSSIQFSTTISLFDLYAPRAHHEKPPIIGADVEVGVIGVHVVRGAGREQGPLLSPLERCAGEDRLRHSSRLASTKNSSHPLCAHTGLVPPLVDTCHLPVCASGNGRTKISGRTVSRTHRPASGRRAR